MLFKESAGLCRYKQGKFFRHFAIQRPLLAFTGIVKVVVAVEAFRVSLNSFTGASRGADIVFFDPDAA